MLQAQLIRVWQWHAQPKVGGN